MRDQVTGPEGTRLEAALRDALQDEARTLRIDVTSSEVRRRIAARRRQRTASRSLFLGLAAVVAVVVAIPLLATVGPQPAATIPPSADRAVTVREAVGPMSTSDLIVETTALSGETQQLARFVDPFGRAGVTAAATADGWSTFYTPDGFLAVDVGSARSGSVVLVFDLAKPDRAPLRIDVTGEAIIGWGPGARLAVFDGIGSWGTGWLASARDWAITDISLPPRMVPIGLGFAGALWTDSGRLAVDVIDRTQFSSTPGTIDPAHPADSFVPGMPPTIWSVDGIIPFRGDRTTPSLGGDPNAPRSTDVEVAAGSQVGVGAAWYLAGPDELLAGQPRFTAGGNGLWFLRYDAAGGLSLVRMAAPGVVRSTTPIGWAGPAAATQIVGVAFDDRAVAVRVGEVQALVGEAFTRALPTGARFAGWARAAALPIPAAVGCTPATADTPAANRTVGPGAGTAGGAALAPVVSSFTIAGATTNATGPWPRETVLAAGTLQVAPGSQVGLSLPTGTCAKSWAVDAVPVAGWTSTPPAPTQLASQGPNEGASAGLLWLGSPEAGDWLVRVLLTVSRPEPGGDTAATDTMTLIFHLRVAGPSGASPSPGPTGAPPSGVIGLDPPGLGDQVLAGDILAGQMSRAGNPAAGVDGEVMPPLVPGGVTAYVACTGRGTLQVAVVTAAPGANDATAAAGARWTRVECAAGIYDTVQRTVDLPTATGGENRLLVGRSTSTVAAPGYSILLGQPIAAACRAPTPADLAAMTLAWEGGTPTAGVVAGYRLPGGALAFDGYHLEANLARPAIAGRLDQRGVLTLPAGICATGWQVDGVSLGQPSSNGISSESWGSPQRDRIGPRVDSAGDQVLRLVVALIGPDGRPWEATLLFHLMIPAAASPSPGQ